MQLSSLIDTLNSDNNDCQRALIHPHLCRKSMSILSFEIFKTFASMIKVIFLANDKNRGVPTISNKLFLGTPCDLKFCALRRDPRVYKWSSFCEMRNLVLTFCNGAGLNRNSVVEIICTIPLSSLLTLTVCMSNRIKSGPFYYKDLYNTLGLSSSQCKTILFFTLSSPMHDKS